MGPKRTVYKINHHHQQQRQIQGFGILTSSDLRVRRIEFELKTPEGNRSSRVIAVDGIILKWKQGVRVYTELMHLWIGLVTDFYGHGNEPSGSIEEGKFD